MATQINVTEGSTYVEGSVLAFIACAHLAVEGPAYSAFDVFVRSDPDAAPLCIVKALPHTQANVLMQIMQDHAHVRLGLIHGIALLGAYEAIRS